jgi:serpin B
MISIPLATRRFVAVSVLMVLLGFNAISCDGSPKPTTGGKADTVLVRSQTQRETSPNVTEAQLAELTAGNNAFAFDLYQSVRRNDGNLIYSPYSVSVALAMTYAGARTDTERQMSGVLHYTLPQNQLHPAFNYLDLGLTQGNQDSSKQSNDGFRLSVANSIWGQVGYSFLPEYLDQLATNYGSGLRLVDFVDKSNREQSRQAINDWVSEATEGKIKDLLAEGMLTEYTRLVLANAIYFNAKWEIPFLNGTSGDEFTLINGERITVPMMSLRTDIAYAEGEGYQAVELLYKGKRIHMIVLLPSQGQFDAFESSLNTKRLDAIIDSLSSRDIRLFMPKFTYEASLNLCETLAGMGMPNAFNPALADFSGMTGKTELFISQIVHKAFIAVDEIGTEAAAATGVIVEVVSQPLEIKINRPFIYVIRDNQTGTILFIGRVMNPLR